MIINVRENELSKRVLVGDPRQSFSKDGCKGLKKSKESSEESKN